MRFEWDEAKNRANIRKHGLDFADAERMFQSALLVSPDTEQDYGEHRWRGIGAIGMRIAVVVFTERRHDRIRIISLRKAARRNLKNMRKRSKTDWKRIDAIRDENIDFSDIPRLDAEFFETAVLWPGPKQQITLRLDPDVLKFFRKRGRGYQTAMNAVLRKYMEVRGKRAKRKS